MARRKIKAKTETKKDDLDPANDEFVSKTMSAFDWAYDRRRPIGLALVVVLLAAVGGITVDNIVEGSREKASTLLAGGLGAAAAPVIPTPESSADAPPAPADDKLVSFETHRARSTATLKEYDKVLGELDGSLKVIAELGKAAAHLDLGEHDKAIASYEKVLADPTGKTGWMQAVAVEGLGVALEASGKAGEGLARFEALIGTAHGSAANMARYHAARLALKTDDREKAKELLKEVVDSYAEEGKLSSLDYLFVQSRARLLEIDPEADVPPAPAGGMGGLEGIDPRILQQLMQARAGGGPG